MPPDVGPGATPADLEELQAEMTDVWRRSRAAVRELAHALDPRLDPTTYPLVAVLGRVGAVRLGELGAVLHLDKSTLSRQVDAVARLGLVERVPDPDDARARRVTLTPAGRARLEELTAVRRERWRASVGAWPAADVRELTRLLGRLRDTGVS